MKRRRGLVIARGLLVVVLLALLPLAAMLQAPRPAVAQAAPQDSLWLVGDGLGDPTDAYYSVCTSPAWMASFANCFDFADSTYVPSGQKRYGGVTDGVNVYYYYSDSASTGGGVSCPIPDLGANCTKIMAGGWNGSYTTHLAATGGYLWIGQHDGQIYRCPANLSYVQQTAAPATCLLVRDQTDSSILTAMTVANGILYAAIASSKRATIYRCNAGVAGSCAYFDDLGTDYYANSMVAGGSYLWVGRMDGYIWRCDPSTKDRCSNYDKANGNITDLSYAPTSQVSAYQQPADFQPRLYAAVWINNKNQEGTLWSCRTSSENACAHVATPNTEWDGPNNQVESSEGGVFSLAIPLVNAGTRKQENESWPNYNAPSLTSTSPNLELLLNGIPYPKFQRELWHAYDLLYVPAGGPVGVGGVSVQMEGAKKLGGMLAQRCKAGKNPKATVTVEFPSGTSKTVKAGACALTKGGAVTRRLHLLDPGNYTVTATAGNRTAQANFTIAQDTTSRVNLKLKRAQIGG